MHTSYRIAPSRNRAFFSPTQPDHGLDQITRPGQLVIGRRLDMHYVKGETTHAIVAGKPRFDTEMDDWSVPILTHLEWGWHLYTRFLTDCGILPYAKGKWHANNWTARPHHRRMSVKQLTKILQQMQRQPNQSSESLALIKQCLADLN